jgi:subtilisin family serine protease
MVRSYNHGITRRRVLKSAAAGVGLSAFGGTVAGTTTMDDRFILMTGKQVKDGDVRTIENAGLEVVHRMDEVGLVVVNGASTDVKKTDYDYAPDYELTLAIPTPANAQELLDDGFEPNTADAVDDEFWGYQWAQQSQNVPEIHSDYTKGEGVRVAVIDSGIDHTHPNHDNVNEELSQAFTSGTCGAPGPYAGGHGTATSGVIAASDDHDAGTVGMAPDVELVDCRIFPPNPGRSPAAEDCADGPDFDEDELDFHILPGAGFGNILQAIVHATNVDCDIINMSLGVGYRDRSENGRFYGQSWARTAAYAASNGSLLVSAAGNASTDLSSDGGKISLLTESPNVMSISATAPVGWAFDDEQVEDEPVWTPAGYTNYGQNVIDVSAPGGGWPSDLRQLNSEGKEWFADLQLTNAITWRSEKETKPDDLVFYPILEGSDGAPYRFLAGTSLAAPAAAGVAALVKSVVPNAPPNEIRSILNSTADDVASSGKSEYHGHGFVNALAAVEKADSLDQYK